MVEETVVQGEPAVVQSPPGRRGRGGFVLFAALLAFVLGAAVVGYAAWSGMVPIGHVPIPAPAAQTALQAPVQPPPPAPASLLSRQDMLEGRIGAMEQRLDAIGAHADAAAGNASRAEALLVALAARRALDRGSPLGYLEDQLRLRFGDKQPNAVATVIGAARTPVTLDELLAGLDTLAPILTRAPEDASAWQRVKRELAGLFVVRHESAPSPAPQVTLENARVLLETGRIAEASTEIRRLPGAASAGEWLIAARRYDEARRALDVLETAALLDPQSATATSKGSPAPAEVALMPAPN